ncbi:MAG TPA: response regulator transcription factor, partial [Bacteroidetes bacterium]|nr:response regulator transcription factor [Bacteroidota bacterium]
SLLDEVKLKELIALEIKYETDLQTEALAAEQAEKVEVKRANFWLWLGLSFLGICLIGAVVLVLRQRRSLAALRQDHFDVSVAFAEVNGRMKTLQAMAGQQLSRAKVEENGGPGLPPDFETLSKREIEVFLCLANGMANKVVAEELHISVDTVRSHVKNIYGKLGLRNRTMVVKLAHEYGLAS